MSESGADKKHDATPHRRSKAREEGQVAKSQDLGSAVLLLVTILILKSTSSWMMAHLSDLMRDQLSSRNYWADDPATVINDLVRVIGQASYALSPLLSIAFMSGIIINVSQTGVMFLPNKLAPDLSRISPMQGLKRLFSITSATRLGFGLLKIGLVAIVMVASVYVRWNEILTMGALPISEVAGLMWKISLDTALRAAIVLVILAAGDFAFQKWKLDQDLKMTDQEVRDEIKTTQGDPAIKSQRRRVQRQLMAQRIAHDVPKADVVITNPTHLAIAIAYDPQTMSAPIVVAKGAESLAARIRKIALEHSIPIVERKPLARALYETVELGQAVPVEQYAAVAEVLKYVYQVQGRSINDLTQAIGKAG
jgi:flagellar biosynthetic protein FlhB